MFPVFLLPVYPVCTLFDLLQPPYLLVAPLRVHLQYFSLSRRQVFILFSLKAVDSHQHLRSGVYSFLPSVGRFVGLSGDVVEGLLSIHTLKLRQDFTGSVFQLGG